MATRTIFQTRALCPWGLLAVLLAAAAPGGEWVSGITWPEPPVIDPGQPGGAPADAVVLFDGSSLDAWEGAERWQIADGVATSGGGSIRTRQSFGDCQFHVEWSAPTAITGSGQGRGNSGIYFIGQIDRAHDGWAVPCSVTTRSTVSSSWSSRNGL